MKIYFDFDGTLYNTTKLYNDFLDVFNRYGISNEQVKNIQKELFKESNFSIEKLCDRLISVFNVDVLMKDDINKLFNNNYVYDDCEDFIKKISNQYQVILFTCGDTNYQQLKINNSKLSKYFDNITITEGEKYLVDIDYENGVFIDNNVLELDRFKSVGAKYLFRMKRMGDSHFDDVGDYETIDKFDDIFYECLVNIIK